MVSGTDAPPQPRVTTQCYCNLTLDHLLTFMKHLSLAVYAKKLSFYVKVRQEGNECSLFQVRIRDQEANYQKADISQ